MYKAIQLSACVASARWQAGDRSCSGRVHSVVRRALTLLNAPQVSSLTPDMVKLFIVLSLYLWFTFETLVRLWGNFKLSLHYLREDYSPFVLRVRYFVISVT